MTVVKSEHEIMMIPFFTQYNICKCGVRNCEHKPFVALTEIADNIPPIGICKEHYNEAKDKGKWEYQIDY